MAGLEALKGLEISTASKSFDAVTSVIEKKKKNTPSTSIQVSVNAFRPKH